LDAAALVMRAVVEGGANAAAPMREAALAEGALLHHLSLAMAGQARARMRLFWLKEICQLWMHVPAPPESLHGQRRARRRPVLAPTFTNLHHLSLVMAIQARMQAPVLALVGF
jgi:hypothetical protein